MINTTKYPATLNEVRAAFRAAGLGEVTNIQELSDGWFNRIFSAIDQKGQKYVIKFAPPKDAPILTYETRAMQSEIDCYREVNTKTKIKTPKIVFYDNSEKVVPTAYFIMEFLQGVRLDNAKLTPKDRLKVTDKTAWILSQFHSLEMPGYGYPQVGLFDNWFDAISKMTNYLITDCQSFGKSCKMGEQLQKYINVFADILKKVPCVLVNYDLHSMNMFYEKKADGKIELSVLDLERCIYGDPIGDFVVQSTFTSLEKKDEVKRYNRYAKTKITGTQEEQVRYFIMMAYLAIIMYTERFSRFQGCGKYFNATYISGTAACKFFKRWAFYKLKKLEKQIGKK